MRIFFSFLLSEHILCKESIVTMKNFDFEILTFIRFEISCIHKCYFYGDVCLCLCVRARARTCVCMCLETIAPKQCIQLSSNFPSCTFQISVRRTLLILGNVVVFSIVKKKGQGSQL